MVAGAQAYKGYGQREGDAAAESYNANPNHCCFGIGKKAKKSRRHGERGEQGESTLIFSLSEQARHGGAGNQRDKLQASDH